MGLNMSLLFADHGYKVSTWDKLGKDIDQLDKLLAKDEKQKQLVTGYKDIDEFLKSFQGKRILMFSITHGHPVDEVLSQVADKLSEGDIIIDGGNEWYLETERRQEEMAKKGIQYIGTGVSGGYQSARRGPSLSPGGEKSAWEQVKPILENVAAKAPDGKPCVALVGPAGSGHYVKMIHNGIEQGMLSVTSEAFELMRSVMGFSHERIAKTFAEWNSQGELKNNFLVKICSEIPTRLDENGKFIMDEIEDKVVQDSDASEGTGVWSVKEAAERHVPCPTISAAHFFRTASAHRDDRNQMHQKWTTIADEPKQATEDPEKILEALRLAVHAGFVASFIQGLNVIAQASIDFDWKLDMATIIDIWKSGCIIQAEYLSEIFHKAYSNGFVRNVGTTQEVAAEVNKSFKALKQIVLVGINANAHIPALSASLEYFKIYGSRHLPTDFMEAQLDYFGGHSYDLKSENNTEIKKGPHHTEWKKP